MIHLEQKLRSNSKFALFLTKYGPETFELKIAKQLNNYILHVAEYYKNYNYGNICKEEFQAICFKQQELLGYRLINKLDEQFFNEHTEHTLLSFYADEIEEFIQTRNSAANSVGTGLGFFYETFNLSNQNVKKLMKSYQDIIRQFFKNYFMILDYKSKNRESSNVVQYSIQNNVIFNNSMSIETGIYLSLKAEVDKLSKLYKINDDFKTKKEHAYIIEYFISNILGLDVLDYSSRQEFIQEVYGVTYNTYRLSFINYTLEKNKMRQKELAESIVFVRNKIEEKYKSEIFNNKLLEKMINKFKEEFKEIFGN